MPQLQLGHNNVRLGQLNLKTKVMGLPKLASRTKEGATPTEHNLNVSRKQKNIVPLMFLLFSLEFPVSRFFLGMMFFIEKRTLFRGGFGDKGTVQRAWTQAYMDLSLPS